MTDRYRAVQWNQHKRVYDLLAVGGIAAYLIVFVGVVLATTPPTELPSDPILAIRATGTLAVIMLHVVLAIGPLARLSSVFNVLLYNRRHFGVLTATVALVHGGLNLGWYFGFGAYANPLAAALATSGGFASLASFPFHLLGLLALIVLLLMAATSHDFWLKNLGPLWWKWMHMAVYLAYALVVGHVLLGAVQAGRGEGYGWALGGGFAVLAGLHLVAGIKENTRPELSLGEGKWIDACGVSEIPDGRAKTLRLKNGDAVAVFRDADKLWAVSNVCAHQQGPLGEGRIVGGCVTCPWHGYQYRPEDGVAPPPFDDRIATYRVGVKGDRVMLNPEPLAPGTAREPAFIASAASSPGATGTPDDPAESTPANTRGPQA